jgi:hypothetical protein
MASMDADPVAGVNGVRVEMGAEGVEGAEGASGVGRRFRID